MNLIFTCMKCAAQKPIDEHPERFRVNKVYEGWCTACGKTTEQRVGSDGSKVQGGSAASVRSKVVKFPTQQGGLKLTA